MHPAESALPDLPWAPFHGGELEGVRPRRRCQACRLAAVHPSAPRAQAICFACYRAELDHNRRLKAAGDVDTASDERFGWAGPFLPVDRARLAGLRAARAAARVTGAAWETQVTRKTSGTREALETMATRWSERRLLAIRAARLALATPATARVPTPAPPPSVTLRGLPLPSAWLPFVVPVVAPAVASVVASSIISEERRQRIG